MRITRIHIDPLIQEDLIVMDPYYTYQDFYTHTKGVIYILMIAALIGIAVFWNFLSGRDDKKR